MCRNLEILFCCLFTTTITYGIYRSEFWYYTKCCLAKSQKQAITKLVKMFTCMPSLGILIPLFLLVILIWIFQNHPSHIAIEPGEVVHKASRLQ